MRFAVVDIGCLECGESSEVLGVYDDQEAARARLAREAARGETRHATEDSFSYFGGGDHSVEVLPVPDDE